MGMRIWTSCRTYCMRRPGALAERSSRRRRWSRWGPRTGRNLATLGGQRQFDDLVGDAGFVAFGVALLHFDHVSNDAAVLAVRKHIDQRTAGLRIMTPTVGARILARGIPHIPRLRIGHLRQLLALAAGELVGQRRGIGWNRLVLAVRENEGIIAGTSRRHSLR